MHETALERTIALAIFAASYVGLGLGRLPALIAPAWRSSAARSWSSAVYCRGTTPSSPSTPPRSCCIALVAIGGAAYSLCTRRVNPEKVYREVNGQLLVLFVGLFVLTGGIERAGLVDDLLGWANAVGLHSGERQGVGRVGSDAGTVAGKAKLASIAELRSPVERLGAQDGG